MFNAVMVDHLIFGHLQSGGKETITNLFYNSSVILSFIPKCVPPQISLMSPDSLSHTPDPFANPHLPAALLTLDGSLGVMLAVSEM